ncbi:MAG TPA: NADH-quinone oxidoreductase subunit J [Planctomycetaceae bacterium]|jgi:NADH-quinone oxidoreductase subunit J|nr:NADH-quinone oxidoreductase subunit J [Planctomycetaceae bacterium]
MNALLEWIIDNRAQLMPPVFGFIALYLLLPREYGFWRPVGIAFGVVSLGVLGFLFGPVGAPLHGALFYLFAGVAIAAAAATVTFANPIYSALSFALVTLSVSGLFVLRGAMFLAATTVIIYAGAIVVMFLFIIMLSRHPGNAPYDRHAREPFLGSLAAFLLLSILLFTLSDWRQNPFGQPAAPTTKSAVASKKPLTELPRARAGFIPLPPSLDPYPHSHMRPDEPSPLRGLGRAFFSDYLFVVELAGTLLLVAGVGAVAIAPRRVRTRVKPPTG